MLMGAEKTGLDGIQVAAAPTKAQKQWGRQRVRERLQRQPALLFWAAHKVRLPLGISAEEFVSELTIRVVSVGYKYDKTKGAFTTWLLWQARAVRTQLMRHSEAQCRASTTVSIEDLTNVIPCSGDHFGWVRREHDRATVVKVMTGISPRDRIICKHLMSGLSMTETGAKVGMSRQAVCYAVDRLREKVRRIGITWEAA